MKINPPPINVKKAAGIVFQTALVGGIEEVKLMSDDAANSKAFAKYLQELSSGSVHLRDMDHEKFALLSAMENMWLDFLTIAKCRVVVGGFASNLMHFLQLMRPDPWRSFFDWQGWGWTGKIGNHLLELVDLR